MTEKAVLSQGRMNKHRAILHIDTVANMITAFFPAWQHAVQDKPD